jgi:hypothetical protein
MFHVQHGAPFGVARFAGYVPRYSRFVPRKGARTGPPAGRGWCITIGGGHAQATSCRLQPGTGAAPDRERPKRHGAQLSVVLGGHPEVARHLPSTAAVARDVALQRLRSHRALHRRRRLSPLPVRTIARLRRPRPRPARPAGAVRFRPSASARARARRRPGRRPGCAQILPFRPLSPPPGLAHLAPAVAIHDHARRAPGLNPAQHRTGSAHRERPARGEDRFPWHASRVP